MTPDARTSLREATRARHDAVDALFADFDLSDPVHYRDFLRAQARAFLPVEAAIDAAGGVDALSDWPRRRRADLLRADLADLGVDDATPVAAPALASAAAVLGAIYVLEGSRLGGAVLRRRVPRGAPTRFLDAPGGGSAWRALIAVLDARLGDQIDRDAALTAADAVFACFETAGSTAREWKSDVRVH